MLGAIFYCYEYLLRIEPSVIVPNLMHEFNITAGTLGFMVAFYYYAYTPMQIIVGVLIDRYGTRLILTLAIIACTIGSLLFSTAGSIYIVGIGRFIIGFGSAFAFVGVLKLAAEWLPKHHFALFTGFTVALGMMGAMGGVIVLNALVYAFSWKQTLYIGTMIGVILIPFMWLIIRDAPKWRKKHVGTKTSFHATFVGLKQIIKNPQMWLAGIIGCTSYLSLSVFAELWGIPFLQAVYRFSPHQTAVACSMIFAGWLIGAPFNGWLSEKTRSRKLPLIIGSLLAAIIAGIIILKPINLSINSLCILLFLFGLFSSTQIICFVISRENNPTHIAATTVAFTNLLVMLGGIVFQPLIGKLLDLGWHRQMHQGIRIYSATNYQHTFVIIPICILVGTILALFLRETYKRKNWDEFDID